MSSFTDPLSTTQLEARLWRVDKGFRYYVGAKRSDYYFDVDEGFTYDGGSIPRIAWFVDAPNGDGAQAYCLHDGLYRSHLTPRLPADRIMDEALGVKGLSLTRRWILYGGVRAGGYWAYNKYTEEDNYKACMYITKHGGPEYP